MKRKLKNGFGSIVKSKRRHFTETPYTVMTPAKITKDYSTGKKKINRKTLGHFSTYEEAYLFLINYNKNPEYYRNRKMTFASVFSNLKEEWFPKLAENSIHQYEYAFRKFRSIYDVPISELRTRELQSIINPYLENPGIKKEMKIILNKVFNYAEKYDIISKNYSKFIDMGKTCVSQTRLIYSEKEIEKLWELKDYDCVKIVLIMLYTGMRLGEVRTVLKTNIFLKDSYMIGGIKTSAGKNRIIPICNKIKPLIRHLAFSEENSRDTLVNTDLAQNQFNIWLRRHLKYLGFDHKSHDCRHTFATNMRNLSVPYEITETIMGHKCNSLLLNTYTHISKDKLIEAVNLL